MSAIPDYNILAVFPTTVTIGASYLSPPYIFTPPSPLIKCQIKQPASSNQINFEITDSAQLYTIRNSCPFATVSC